MTDEMTSNKPYLVRAVYEWICDNGMTPHIMVMVDYPGVEVPMEYATDGKIVLNVAPQAVVSLDLGNDEISFSARFNGVPMQVRCPVDAVMAVYARENGEGMFFEVSPPEEPEPGSKVKVVEARDAQETRKQSGDKPSLRIVK